MGCDREVGKGRKAGRERAQRGVGGNREEESMLFSAELNFFKVSV